MTVRFPIFESLSVRDYDLYPGPDGKGGLEIEFQGDENLVLGVNGLGKSTMLLLLKQMIEGPVRMRPPGFVGERQADWTLADANMFAVRADDGAVAASAELVLRLNSTAFLAERCELVIEEETRRFGTETDHYPMPRFTVRLTSGVFRDQPQPRRDDGDVSESQKEFIDLAFRLALMSVASEGRPSMMVIETPEASLDSLFIARAGRLLAAFAGGGGRTGNRLVASSNLNKEDMIPALFGLASEEDYEAWWRRRKTGSPPESAKAVPLEERRTRTLNLLDEAAENMAVERHRTGYEARFERAMDPPWSHPPARNRR